MGVRSEILNSIPLEVWGDRRLLIVLAVLTPICLFFGSLALLRSEKTLCTVLQVVGSACLLLAVLTHVPEALHSWEHWLAVAGLTCFSVAFFIHALLKSHR